MACGALLAACAVGAGIWFARQRACERKAAETASARSAFLKSFGIHDDGRRAFIPLPPRLPHHPARARLGRDLFQDKRLVSSPRRTCGSCHLINRGGTDGKTHGGHLTRPIVNAVFASRFQHDGSATNFADAVSLMVTGAVYGAGVPLAEAARLMGGRDPAFAARCRTLFGAPPCASNLVAALSQYVRTLLSANGPFDRYLDGHVDALTAEQRAGFEVFKRRNCAACHNGPVLGTLVFHEGLKVPALRGLAQRRTYGDDGAFDDLGAILTRMPGGALEEAERTALLAFLRCL